MEKMASVKDYQVASVAVHDAKMGSHVNVIVATAEHTATASSAAAVAGPCDGYVIGRCGDKNYSECIGHVRYEASGPVLNRNKYPIDCKKSHKGGPVENETRTAIALLNAHTAANYVPKIGAEYG
ncbi:hypothetical protein BBBOND_0110530 [Babesia bigemina]|uniref:Uncharacterized protein n=1 Tax=Babesia bigemina TaxID=5866 RepID=A0A061DAL1_BABBI|nr:hypothetical protein BBBOND_0110530 [Babesia bigemina]CDR94755.1 hypothetical protein BBBOND_0110530 [Babesia bigemina]|eukprot:XP_012766941.1 hypothetical protein BBBOND_0110530 [Babesia bigemina]